MPGAAKSARTARGSIKFLNHADRRTRDRRHHHLRDSHPVLHRKCCAPKIHQRHLHLTAVITVNGAWRIRHANPMLRGKTRPRSNLRFKAVWNCHGKSARNHRDVAGRKSHRRFDAGVEVEARRVLGLVGGELRALVEAEETDFDGVHGAEPSAAAAARISSA